MTTTQHSAVVGVFTTRAQAENAINDLHSLGFTEEQIGYVARDAGTTEGDIAPTADASFERSATTGAVSGGVLGGILGAAASLLIPGFGPAIAGGILAATLGGAAIGAAAGGLMGALTQMGVPEEDARYYQGEFESGRLLVTVHAPGREQEALSILHRNGAYDASTQPGTYDATGAVVSQPGTLHEVETSAATVAQPGTFREAGAYDSTIDALATDQPGTLREPTTYDPNDPNAPRI